MSEVTQILSQMEKGDLRAAEQLLPLVYEELRKLAAAKLAQEKPGQTLQATALVHEAYLRLVGANEVRGQRSEVRGRPSATSDLGPPTSRSFDSRGHFFGAAAEAMRRISVERARRKGSGKHGGGFDRLDAEMDRLPGVDGGDAVEMLAMHEALDCLASNKPVA
jgi:hypothetical protein